MNVIIISLEFNLEAFLINIVFTNLEFEIEEPYLIKVVKLKLF